MSVEPSELMSEVWTRWQGHLVNGVFPLGRCLGCSDHSGVFLTQSAARGGELAIKLVPTNRTLAEAQLPRWKRAGALTHPHLLRLLEWGGCQLDGLPYLYAVMEYADQTLAQLLLSRALTADEAQELLQPSLEALAFLHARNLLQGQLKPTNILVVGDQLKLASDTIRRVSDPPMSNHAPTVYDAPEERQGSSSTAADVWALGVTLFEAVTRHQPRGLGESGKGVMLPADFPPALRELVASCLSPSAYDRPSVTELFGLAGLRAPPIPAAPEPSAAEPSAAERNAVEPPAPKPATPSAPAVAVAAASRSARSSAPEFPKPRAMVMAFAAAAVAVALLWTGVRLFRAHHSPAAVPVQAPQGSLPQAPQTTPPATSEPRAPGRGEIASAPTAVHEVIPDVSRSARRTIRGHINVWVRVIVDQGGSVIAATTDRNGPSRYFQRVALEAARQWTFPPADSPAQRLMQIRFDFSREGTSAHAVPVH